MCSVDYQSYKGKYLACYTAGLRGTYDEAKQEGAVLYWRCRYNGDAEVTFTCSIKEK
jgi:hypothetical protein